jgi:hypothetical protein
VPFATTPSHRVALAMTGPGAILLSATNLLVALAIRAAAANADSSRFNRAL